MKRVCKAVKIDDLELIIQATYACLRPAKKRQRADTRAMFARLLEITKSQAKRVLMKRGELYDEGVRRVALMLQECIIRRELNLVPVRQEMRQDPSSKKMRLISILGIRQLLFDHVAVLGMQELAARIGEYQVSSIPGRGAAYGKRAVERWLAKVSCKYAVKMDIRNFYGSVKREVMMEWLRRRVKNEPLLWLLRQLICNAPEGMAIGSYLSQTLANIYLSDLYHLAMERCVNKRGKRQVKHALFYMDDMLLLGTNKRGLKAAAQALTTRAEELGLEVKPEWHVFKITPQRPVDVMGFRFSHGMTTLRKRIFKAARRAILRAGRSYRKRGRIGLRMSCRLASYHGYMLTTACKCFLHRTGAHLIFQTAFKQTSSHAKN